MKCIFNNINPNHDSYDNFSALHEANTTLAYGFPLYDPLDSIVFTKSILSITRPKTTCFPSNFNIITIYKIPNVFLQ